MWRIFVINLYSSIPPWENLSVSFQKGVDCSFKKTTHTKELPRTAFYKMLKVTSHQLPVVGWDFGRRRTVLRLQNFFTNTISLKPGTYIHELHFSQYFKKHQFWDR